jgi:hypothetical protein
MSLKQHSAPSTWPLSVTGYDDHERTRRLPARACSRGMSSTGTPRFITCPARMRSIKAVSTPPSNSVGRRPMTASSGRPNSRRNAALVRLASSSGSRKTMAVGAWSNSASSSRRETRAESGSDDMITLRIRSWPFMLPRSGMSISTVLAPRHTAVSTEICADQQVYGFVKSS